MDGLEEALLRLSLDPETALSERVAPLLHAASPGTSAPVLRRAYYETAARNVTLLDALEEIGSLAAAKGIRPTVLKGADLALSLYPNLALRPMSDLDVWVGGDEVAPMEDTLAALGYRPGCPEMTPGLGRAVKHARLYVSGRKDVAVDLHWSLIGHDGDRRSPRLAWFRAHRQEARTRSLFALDSTAHLLYLSAHMKLQHYDERPPLLWLADFYLLSHRDVEWDSFFSAARAFGWETAVAAACEEVEARLGVNLPAPLARAEAAGTLPSAVPRRKGGAERALNELATLGFRGRALLLRAYVLPSPSYIRWRYRPRPRWIWPLFYAVRWARLVTGFLSVVTRPRRSRPVLHGPS